MPWKQKDARAENGVWRLVHGIFTKECDEKALRRRQDTL